MDSVPRAVVIEGSTRYTFQFVSRDYYPFDFVRIEVDESTTIVAQVVDVRAVNDNFGVARMLYYIDRPIDSRLRSDTIYRYEARSLGLLRREDKLLQPSHLPAPPGSEVEAFTGERLGEVLGLSVGGDRVAIGVLKGPGEIQVGLGADFFFGHSAILGQTGSGKSHLARVLLDVIIKLRARGVAEIVPIILDASGEYSSSEVPYQSLCSGLEVIDAVSLRLPVFSRRHFGAFSQLLDLSQRERGELLQYSRGRGDVLTVRETSGLAADSMLLAEQLERTSARGLVEKLAQRNIKFQYDEHKPVFTIPKACDGLIVSLRGFDDIAEAQFSVRCVLDALIDRARKEAHRRERRFVVFVEEAHNLIPSVQSGLCKEVLLRIAREGRKLGLFLCLISQRPRWVDPTALSQCRTTFLLRTQNPDDINHIFEYVPFAAESQKASLPIFGVGEAVMFGFPSRLPTLFVIREVDDAFHRERQRERALTSVRRARADVERGTQQGNYSDVSSEGEPGL